MIACAIYVLYAELLPAVQAMLDYASDPSSTSSSLEDGFWAFVLFIVLLGLGMGLVLFPILGRYEEKWRKEREAQEPQQKSQQEEEPPTKRWDR